MHSVWPHQICSLTFLVFSYLTHSYKEEIICDKITATRGYPECQNFHTTFSKLLCRFIRNSESASKLTSTSNDSRDSAETLAEQNGKC